MIPKKLPNTQYQILLATADTDTNTNTDFRRIISVQLRAAAQPG